MECVLPVNHWRPFLLKVIGILISTPRFIRRSISWKIIRHTCHYHLYDQGKGYHHKDPAFTTPSASGWTPDLTPHLYQKNRESEFISTDVLIVDKSIGESEIDLKKYACGRRCRLQFLEMRQE